eukprot:SAG22_NODE_1237_length_5050_cov_1.625404_4_plen_236_part_00
MAGLDDRPVDVLGGDEFGGDVAESFCIGPVLAWKREPAKAAAAGGVGVGGAGAAGGSGIVASGAAQGRPALGRLLNRFGQAVLPAGAAWTSVSVNRDYHTVLHVDRCNYGPCWIIGLGDYTGGRLWTEELGAVDVKGRPVAFDGNLPHCTLPFEGGRRYTLVYWTHSMVDMLQPVDRAFLAAELGFVMPTPESQPRRAYAPRAVRMAAGVQAFAKWQRDNKQQTRLCKPESMKVL